MLINILGMQEADLESSWGQRNVLISRKPFLLEGLNLNRRNPFDAVISSPVQVTVEIQDLLMPQNTTTTNNSLAKVGLTN
jgi:hypothetical protein